jgi:hypothetical protein
MNHKHHKIIFKDDKRIKTNILVEYTIEEHANEHKRLYEEGGHWQDRLAWKGLSGQIGKDEIHAEIYKNRIPGHTGKKHTGDLRRFGMATKGTKLTKEHKAKIDPTGRKQPQSQKDKVAEALSKEYIITDPQGKIYHIKNLRKFCTEYGLDQGNMTRVSKGIIKKNKGWLCKFA